MFQVSINSIQNISVIVRKQNFNLIVDATQPPARHTDQRQSIGQNFSLKNPRKIPYGFNHALFSKRKSFKQQLKDVPFVIKDFF